MAINQTQRPRYYEQQYIGADDLNQAVEYGRIQQARHALGGHTWGIALGLELVERERPGGVIDVYVTPGYGWEGFGRPIVMLEPTPLGPQFFQSYPFLAGVDDQNPLGRLFTVWIAYDEQGGVGPRPYFEVCDVDDQNRRIEETFKLEVTEFRPPSPPPARGTHDDINVAGESVVPQDALNAPKVPPAPGSSPPPPVNQIYDESIPFQIFPVLGERKRWPIPIGVVRWQPAHSTVPGRFIKRKDPEDLAEHRRARRNIGVVAESVQATDGHVRIKDRKKDNSPLWSDDLAWVEGKLRVDGDTRLLNGALLLRNQNNKEDDFPVTIRRTEVANSKVLQVLIGNEAKGNNRFSIGPEVGGNAQEKLVVLDDGKVGIGTVSPPAKFTVFAENDGGVDALQIHGAESSASKYGVLNVHDAEEYVRLGYLNGAQRKNIFLDGKVGVGMPKPVGRLTLEGVVQPQQGTLSFFSNDADIVYDGGSDKSFIFKNTNADGKTAFLGGNVGIGAANPVGKLTVEAPEHINVILDRTDSQDHMTLTVGSAGTGIHFGNSNRFFLSADAYADRNTKGFGNELFTLLASGNVGIGTTSPENKLHVAAPGHINAIFDRTDTQDHMTLTVGSLGTGIHFSNSNRFFISADPYTTRNSLDFGNEVLTILPNGNVGVGTPAPNEKLTLATPGGGTPVSAMSIDVGTFGTNANAEASYFFRVRDLGAPSIPFLIRGDGTVFATGFVPSGSDRSLKKDITLLTGALDKLLQLRGVNFSWREPERMNQRGPQIGLIAQEVEQIFPDWVTTAPNGHKALMIHGFEALVVEALRELHDEIEALKKSLARIGSSQPEKRERKRREPKEQST